jgi:hypothetical protein
MRGAVILVFFASGLLLAGKASGQEPPAAADPPESLAPELPCPQAKFDVPPTLAPAAPRMGLAPAVPPVADPRVILFHPYFFPTHDNFRPLPYGYPPADPGFFYGAYANPYYYQYYGPGSYFGF